MLGTYDLLLEIIPLDSDQGSCHPKSEIIVSCQRPLNPGLRIGAPSYGPKPYREIYKSWSRTKNLPRRMTLEVDQTSTKLWIQDKTNSPMTAQVLTYASKILHDDLTLSYYCIEKDFVLFPSARLCRGGLGAGNLSTSKPSFKESSNKNLEHLSLSYIFMRPI
jgi:hypothetical protein